MMNAEAWRMIGGDNPAFKIKCKRVIISFDIMGGLP
jgi:hypothetical protein